MRGKKEEVETECSARELVHTEVAVSAHLPFPLQPLLTTLSVDPPILTRSTLWHAAV